METNSTGSFFSDLLDNWPSAYEVYLKIETSATILWVRQKSSYLLPLFCMVGIVGNSMALMLIRTNFWLKRLTSNTYLCVLSLSSCLFLSTLLVTWADSIYTISLYRHNEIGCKIFTFLAHWSDFICVWMISWISCDRMIVLYRPGVRKYICTKKFGNYLTIGTCCLSAVLYCWVFLFAGEELQRTPSGHVVGFCGLSMHATFFGYPVSQYYFIFTLMDTVVCTILPSIVIIVVNAFSTFRYRQCMKIYSAGILRVRFSNNNHIEHEDKITVRYLEPQDETTSAKRLLLSPSQTKQNATATVTQTGSSVGIPSGPGQSQMSSNSRCGKLRSSDLQLSRTLLIVTSTFVLLNVPNYIMRIFQYSWNPDTQIFHLVHYMTYLMYYLHHAVLFYMYIFWSPQMKKQLKPTAVRLLECYCLKSVPEFGHHSTSGGI